MKFPDKFLKIIQTNFRKMNCFQPTINPNLLEDEVLVAQKQNVKVYDESSDKKLGQLSITTHHLYWGTAGGFPNNGKSLKLQLRNVKSVREEWGTQMVFGRKRRLVLEVLNTESGTTSVIRLSGPEGIDTKTMEMLNEVLAAKVWNIEETKVTTKRSFGIGGIQKSISDKIEDREKKINVAFQDLTKLISMAKDIVTVSKSISAKIQKREDGIEENETIKFKSALMNLGIEDPVCKDNFQNNREFLKMLANEITQVVLESIIKSGGMMTIVEVYCRINRARGLELVSPEDVLNACRLMSGPITLKQYPSGALILQLENHDDSKVVEEIKQTIEEKNSLSVEELASYLNISLLLAKEKFLIAEKGGVVCRDESIEGLRFYSNLFL